MAECIVEVCRIEKVYPHPNADALELAQIKGGSRSNTSATSISSRSALRETRSTCRLDGFRNTLLNPFPPDRQTEKKQRE